MYSVVVVARDHPRQLLATLLALRRHSQPAEVLLVDNASTTDLAGVAALSQLPVRVLRSAEHQSLGAAYNLGLDTAATDTVLLLHSDAVLQGDPALGLEVFHRYPDVGVIGAKLLHPAPTPRRVLHAGYECGAGRLGPTSIGRFQPDHFGSMTDVAAVSDACMLVRRASIRFDERYWFRLGDVDLCHQYAQSGQRVVCLPSLEAVHGENAGAQERSRAA